MPTSRPVEDAPPLPAAAEMVAPLEEDELEVFEVVVAGAVLLLGAAAALDEGIAAAGALLAEDNGAAAAVVATPPVFAGCVDAVVAAAPEAEGVWDGQRH
jgi:hypothetical protein